MAPIISVIIPAYNTADYIARSINSALQQTLQEIEVIVVDDASVDSTVDVINSFTDSRLVKVFSRQNLGAGGARNKALNAATGTWVAVLDSDDWFAPERLERLLQVAEKHGADIVADDLYFIQDGEDNPWSTLIQESQETISDVCLIDPVRFVSTSLYGQQGLHLGLSKPLFRREFLVENQISYDESVKVSQDFWLDMDCLKHGAKFYLLPEAFYYYRSRPGSLVNDNNRVRHLSDDKRKIVELLKNLSEAIDTPEFVRYLQLNLRIINQNLAYYRVVEPLKNKNYWSALKELPVNPLFFVHLAVRFPSILARRLRYYLFKDKLAFEMMYQADQN